MNPDGEGESAVCRVAGYTYDAAGNLLYDGVNHYTYDDENRVLTAALLSGGTEQYIYDAGRLTGPVSRRRYLTPITVTRRA